MARRDKPGVFDVSKPGKATPSATSRPVIVGHHPQIADPMVKDETSTDGTDNAVSKHIPIAIDGEEKEGEKITSRSMMDHAPAAIASIKSSDEDDAKTYDPAMPAKEEQGALIDHTAEKKIIAPVNPDIKPEDELNKEEKKPDAPPEFTPVDSALDDKKAPSAAADGAPKAANQPPAVTAQPLHITGVKGTYGNTRTLKRAGVGLIVLLIVAYLLIDAGVVGAGINLPFHIFNKQPKKAQSAPPPSPSPAPAAQPVTPSNLTAYTIAGTGISFKYPTTWGTASTTPELGYESRGGGAKPSGDYAYLVNFTQKQDVQIAVTSSRYLPPSRTPLYYDYLQWCMGTNDGKFYKSVLLYTTSGGIDSPSTIACNQGPLTDATKLDTTTLFQAKTLDSDGKTVLGDLYTKNLTDPYLQVLRVKDSSSSNGDAVKKLLATIKVVPTAAAPTSTP